MSTKLKALRLEAERYLTHLSTDKPIYKPNDTVFLRGILLHAKTQKPLAEKDKSKIEGTLKILGPGGATVITKKITLLEIANSVFTYNWNVPSSGQSGGDYKFKIEYKTHGCASSECGFEIRVFQNPRLNSQLVFVRKGYGSGDKATAKLNVKRAEGGVPEGATVTALARIDGNDYSAGSYTIDKKGECLVSFSIPKQLDVGKGTLTCIIKDQGVVESASKTIPIILKAMDVTFYPEGGDLVVGLKCGCYVEAFTPYGEPADLTGEILEKNNVKKPRIVARVSTKHEGRGKFTFIPQKNKKYQLRVIRPSGVQKLVDLPQPKKKGVSLMSTENIYGCGDVLTFKLFSSYSGTFCATAFKRDSELSSFIVSVDKEEEEEENEWKMIYLGLPLKTKADGVLRVLVTDYETGKPLAERLVFRTPKESITVRITQNYKSYSPGDTVKLKLKTLDQKGKPVKATVCLTVTDESVLESIEKRKQKPRLKSLVYLEKEVDHLEDANIYFNQDDPKSESAVDLLLGCQGWRRFAFEDISAFIEKNKDKGERIAGLHSGVVIKPPQIETRRSYRNYSGIRYLSGGHISVKKSAKRYKRKKSTGLSLSLEKKSASRESRSNHAPVTIISGIYRGNKRDIRSSQPPLRIDGERDIRSSPPPLRIDGERVYAYKKRVNRQIGERINFSETVYWSAGITTTDKGEGEVTFDLSDSVTSFRVLADSFNEEGALGEGDRLICSKEPFYIEPKIPMEVTSGDILQIPIVAVNSSSGKISSKFNTSIEGGGLKIDQEKGDAGLLGGKGKLALCSSERKRMLLNVVANYQKESTGENKTTLTINGSAGAFADSVKRDISVMPNGFPIEIYISGKLEKEHNSQVFQFDIPKGTIKSSVVSNLEIMRDTSSNISSALTSLLKQPSGCFEQTTATSYPTVLAMNYFLANGADAESIDKARKLLDVGYQKLTTFEYKKQGYEWYGTKPGVESLTALAILQFTDMAKVYPVDMKMLDRITNWLLNRRDGHGKFKRNSSYYSYFGGAAQQSVDSYICWALTEAGVGTDLSREINYNYKNYCGVGRNTNRPASYILALIGNCFCNTKQEKQAIEVLDKLVEFQEDSGMVKGTGETITRSYGKSKNIEVTSLAILGWLKSGKKYQSNVKKAVKWLLTQCQRGRFSSTQGTILALKAIVANSEMNPKQKRDGVIQVIVDKKHKFFVAVKEKAKGNLKCKDFGSIVSSIGSHTIEIISNDVFLPFTFSLEFYSIKPESSKECQVDISTEISNTNLTEGAGADITVTLSNKISKKQGMTMAIIGLPGGVEPRHAQLKELVQANTIDFYEINGRNVVVYFRAMKEKETKVFKIDILARIPGKYTAPASCAYLYYADEFKKWVDGIKVTISPEGGVFKTSSMFSSGISQNDADDIILPNFE